MSRLLPFFLLGAAIFVVQGTRAGVNAKDHTLSGAALPVGKWQIEFTNGVTEVCWVGNGGEVTVDEPRRGSNGLAVVRGGSIMMTFQDDRVERWTPVGRRFVVEHWYPGSQVPSGAPVLGIADRTE
jgi:hypothetical protein